MNAWLEHEADGLSSPPDCCACSEDHAAFAAGGSIYLLQLSRYAAPPTVLQPSLGGPSSSISSLCLAQAQLGTSSSHTATRQLLLIAATPRNLCIWSVPDVLAAIAAADRAPAPLRLGAAAAGGQGAGPGALAVEPSSSCLAVGRGWDVETWSLGSLQQDLRLTGHEGAVTALCFSPTQPWQLVSGGEDRMFMVWDLHQGACLFQSHILSSAPITILAFDPAGLRLTTGQTDGKLRFFDLNSLPRCSEEHAVDIGKELTKAATAAAAGGGQQAGSVGSSSQVRVVGSVRQQVHQLAAASGRWDTSQRSPEAPCFDAQGSSSSILSFLHIEAPTEAAPAAADSDDTPTSHGLRSAVVAGRQQQQQLLLPGTQLLLVATPHALLLLNAASYAVLRVLWLGQVAEDMSQQALPSAAGGSAGAPPQLLLAAPTAACCAAALQSTAQQVTAVVGALVSCDVAFIGIALEPPAAAGRTAGGVGLIHASQQQQGGLSIYQEQHLPPWSVLLEAGTGTSSTSSGSGSGSGSGTATTGNSRLDRGTSIGAAGTAAAAGGAGNRPRWGASSGSGTDVDVGSSRSSKDASKGRSTTAAGSSSKSAQETPRRTAAGPSSSSSSSKPRVKPGRQLTDQPVTFHRKVKSSGYGFVQPKVQLGCSRPAPVKVSLQPQVQQQLARHLAAGRQYPLEAEPSCCLDASLGLPGGERVHSAAVLGLAYSGDGSRLLTGSADHSARALLLPLARHKGSGTDFRGHNAPIAAVSWSLDGSRCITAGMDRTACLWGVGRVTPLLRFTHLHQPPRAAALPPAPSGISSSTPGRPLRQSPALSPASRRASSSSSSTATRSKLPGRSSSSLTAGSTTASGSSNVPSSSSVAAGKELGDVAAAKFFRMDEFVVLGSGNQVLLYRYDISSASEDADDITRLRAANLSTYTLAGSYTSSSQALLDVSVVNGCLSTLALTAGSNRTLELVDTAVCQVVATVPEAHTRPVYRLVQPQPSPWVDPGRDAYQLFASLAQDGTCRLWDLRCCQAVRMLTGIGNSQLRTGATFSPCMRYFAAGSQDQCVMLWDLRSGGGLLQRTRVAGSQGVADVAWHPLVPQLALGCMDGSVRFCSSDAGDRL